MTRLRFVVLLWVCVLVPGAARAQDGGWGEWLQKLSGPTLFGVGTDINLLCLSDTGEHTGCGRIVTYAPAVDFPHIKHEFGFRVGFYSKIGSRFSDVQDDRSVHAWKLMGLYHYYVTPSVHLGVGAGYMVFYGEGFELFSRGILMPLSVVLYPFQEGYARSVYLRAEQSYITQGFTGAIFGNPSASLSTTYEWNFSAGLGIDLRRR